MYALSLLTLTLILITFLNLWNFYFDLFFESRPKKVGAPDCREQNSLAFAIMFVENYKLYNFFFGGVAFHEHLSSDSHFSI